MKINWKKVFYFVMFLGSLVGFNKSLAQINIIKKTQSRYFNQYSISGYIFENDNKTTIPFCNIVVFDQNNKIAGGANSNIDGFFTINFLREGLYTIKASFVGYNNVQIDSVFLKNNIEIKVNLTSKTNSDNKILIISCYQIPLINPFNTTSGETIKSDDIKNMPIRR